MSKHLNRVTLIGVIGATATMDAHAGYTAVCKFSLGVTEQWRDKGAIKTQTDWHKVVVLGKQAENLYPILGTGKRLYVEGRLQNRDIVVQGKTVTVSNIKAERVIVLGHDRDVEKDMEREDDVPDQPQA